MSRHFHDGSKDGLTALEPLNVSKTGNFAQMLEAMSRTAFGGRELGEAYHVLLAMARDPKCKIVVTVSGAMTIAKQGRILCEMIQAGLCHMIISTGALMAHGLSEAVGGVHYKYDPTKNDKQLFELGYNRVYDTLEMEQNLNDTEKFMRRALGELEPGKPTCSHHLNRRVGQKLIEAGMMPSILGVAAKHDVPVYVPAFTDSELGLDVATFTLNKTGAKKRQKNLDDYFSTPPAFNPFLDLFDYAKRCVQAKTLGIFTIGGGVPRNWAQQVGPFFDIQNHRLGTKHKIPRFKYAIRICPEPVHWGGLSGCTYSEGVSWGKFIPPSEGGKFAEVHADATIAWPILIRGVLESLGRI